jgi:SAM-dependent methyltransferase
MDRSAWLNAMRRDCEVKYDIRWAPFYRESASLYPNPTHQAFIQAFLNLLPQASTLLDAACGAGRYVPDLLAKGHTVIGLDQAQGMLDVARARFPSVHFEKVGLQEMAFQDVFGGAICMDAMENVCPEEWPIVLSNFHRALKAGGYLYFTAETIENADEDEIREAFARAQQAGLPVVYGEWPDEDEVYHFHPANQQVKAWVQDAGFEILKEGSSKWYFHLLVRNADGL